jgi:hypothetical protein
MERHIQMLLDQNRKAIRDSLRETAEGITPYDVQDMRNVLESQVGKRSFLIEYRNAKGRSKVFQRDAGMLSKVYIPLG